MKPQVSVIAHLFGLLFASYSLPSCTTETPPAENPPQPAFTPTDDLEAPRPAPRQDLEDSDAIFSASREAGGNGAQKDKERTEFCMMAGGTYELERCKSRVDATCAKFGKTWDQCLKWARAQYAAAQMNRSSNGFCDAHPRVCETSLLVGRLLLMGAALSSLLDAGPSQGPTTSSAASSSSSSQIKEWTCTQKCTKNALNRLDRQCKSLAETWIHGTKKVWAADKYGAAGNAREYSACGHCAHMTVQAEDCHVSGR